MGVAMRTVAMSADEVVARSAEAVHHHRHLHLNRRAFLGGAVAGGAVLGSGLFTPAAALRPSQRDLSPKPTTARSNIGGVDFSLTFFGPETDPSSITDFNG